MNKYFDFAFISLLLAYPFINMLPGELEKVGMIWGALSSVFIFLVLIVKIKHINRYMVSALIIFTFILISVFLSKEVNFYKILSGYKYCMPLLLASYIYYFPLNKERLEIIYKITFVYLFFMLILFTVRLSYVNFNPLLVTLYKDYVWYEKSHNFAQMYLVLTVVFLYFSYLLKKNLYLPYLLFLPIFFVGVRSVILGLIFFILSFLIPIIIKNLFKSIIVFSIVIISLVFIQPDFTRFTPLFLSAQDAAQGAENATVTSMSSGRDVIFDFYVNALEIDRIFIGSGFQYLEKSATFNFGLHNDTLEFFFSFGVFGLVAFIFSIYYFIFYDAYKNTSGMNRNFIVSLSLLFFAVSSFAFFISQQLVVYFFLLIYVVKYHPIDNMGKEGSISAYK